MKFEEIQKLANRKLNQSEIGRILKRKRQTINSRIRNNKEFTNEEVEKIFLGLNINLTSTQEPRNKEQVLTCIKIIEYQLQAIKKLIS